MRRPGHQGNSQPTEVITEIIYKNYAMDVSLELKPRHLLFVFRTIMKDALKGRTDLSATAERIAANISPTLSDDNLDQMAVLLQTYLDTTSDLSPSFVACLHTYLGLIHEQRRQYSSAGDSFVKALWMRQASHDHPYHVALAAHRIGRTQGKAGNYQEACATLLKALSLYDSTELAKDHPFVISAQDSLETFVKLQYRKHNSRRKLLMKKDLSLRESRKVSDNSRNSTLMTTMSSTRSL